MKNGLASAGGYAAAMPIEWQSVRSGVLCHTNAVIDFCRIAVRNAAKLKREFRLSKTKGRK